MRIVVTGGSGMLGHNLMRCASREHEVWGSFHTHRVNIPGCRMFPLDLVEERDSAAMLKKIQPDAIVHTAAMTDVDECEKERDLARRINAEGTGLLAAVAEDLHARFIYISTDYVFDGERGNYVEADTPAPVNRYGETKLMGEELVRQRCSQALILRTTMYGLKLPPRRGLMETLLEAISGGKTLPRFVDQCCTPLYTGELSEVLLRFVDLGISGLFHVGAGEKVSRLEFARQVAQVFGLNSAAIQPVPFKQIDGLARRPRDTSLVSRAVERRLSIGLPKVKVGLERFKSDWKCFSEGESGNDRRCSN
jgi:dTDP-4-dehydrorhamnose reductase